MLSVQQGMNKIGDSVDIPTTVRGLLPRTRSGTGLPNLSAPLSDGVRNMIKRSTSFGAAKQRRMHNQITNIFCSEMVGWDSILADFQQALKDPTVTQLEIEDLLSSPCHSDLMAVAGKLVFAKDRAWEVLRFLDSFEAHDFDGWQEKKESMMRDYERCWKHLPDGNGTKSITSFKAVVAVPKGTLVTDMVKLLKTIKNDTDVVEMTLYGDQGAQVEHEQLTDLVDADGDLLKHTLSMELECRWAEPTATYKLYINNCIYRLQHHHKLHAELIQEGDLDPHCPFPAAPKRRSAFNTHAALGESSLQAMRRSIEAGNGKIPVGRRSAPEKRTSRKNLRRCASDSGDVIPVPPRRGVARSSSGLGDDIDHRRMISRRVGSSRSLQRAVSDSGDVRPRSLRGRANRSDPTLQRTFSDAASPRRKTRRSSKREDREAADSSSPRRRARRSSKTEDREGAGDTPLRRAMSGSGDAAPRRKPRRKLSKSVSMDDDSQPQTRPLRRGKRPSENSLPGLQRALSDCGDAKRRPRKVTSMQDAQDEARKEQVRAKMAAFQRSSTTPVPTRTRAIPHMSNDSYFEDTATEYSEDMESDFSDDEDELEAMQLKELQILSSTGSNMSIKDLMALRKTLDAAIASIQTVPDSHKWWEHEDTKMPARDNEEGPDYDWERGVYCQKRSSRGPPRAA